MNKNEPVLILRDADYVFNFEGANCVLVILFTSDFKILTIENKRGHDIPGGHIERYDINFETTARRELMEEAQTTAGKLDICGVLEAYYDDQINNEPTHMVIMTGYIEKLEEFKPNNEIFNRAITLVNDFLSLYRASPVELMSQMIKSAKEQLMKRR